MVGPIDRWTSVHMGSGQGYGAGVARHYLITCLYPRLAEAVAHRLLAESECQ